MRVIAVYVILLVHLIDTSVANVALLSITTDLMVDMYEGQWIITAFGIGVVAAIPCVSRLVTWLGTATALTVALLLSALSLALCGMGETFGVFVLSRLLGGLSSGTVVLLCQKLLLSYVGKERAAFGLALWSSAMALAPVVGPVFGAYVIHLVGWRWLFLGQLPVLLVCCACIPGEFALRRGGSGACPSLWPTVLLGMAALFLQLGLEEWLSLERDDPLLYGSYFALCIGAAAAQFALSRRSASRLFDWTLLRRPAYRNFTGLSALLAGVVVSTSVGYTLWMQTELNLPLLEVAQVLAAGGLIAGVLSPLIGHMKDKRWYPAMVCAGLSCMLVSFWLCTGLSTRSTWFDLALPRIIAGFGTALCSPSGYLSLGGLEPARVLEANSLSLFSRLMVGNVMLAVATEWLKKLQVIFSENQIAQGIGSRVYDPDTVGVVDDFLKIESATAAMHAVYWAGIVLLGLVLFNVLRQNRWIPGLRPR
jgi:MFS family permease